LLRSLNNLVSELLETQRHVEADRLGRLEIDHKLKLGRCLNRKVGRLLSTQDTVDIAGLGFIASFAHPGGNITGFAQYEPSMVGKWLSTLKEIAPATGQVAIVVNPETAPLRGTFYLREFENAAATLGVKPITNFVHNEADVEAAIAALGQAPNSGLIVAPETFTTAHRKLFIALAERNRVRPASQRHCDDEPAYRRSQACGSEPAGLTG
jgi:hypothetical protein